MLACGSSQTNKEDAIAARKEAEKKYYAPMLKKHKDMMEKKK